LNRFGLSAAVKATGGGALSRTDFAGQQAGAVMIHQKLQPRLGLTPGLRGKQLFAVGAVAERRFL
jgi:hypothetical protein